MTLYSVSNKSIEDVDPLKQAGQVPPTYTPEPEHPSPVYQHTAPVEQQQPVSPSKRTMGERFHKISSKAGWPLNKAANLVGAEGWWPTSMDKECNKAARILHSFTGLSNSTRPNSSGPMHPTGLTRKSMVKIPPSVLQNAAGLAIFNVLRAGACHGSLAAGSGVVIARRSDGTWSPPSAFVVSTLGAGFVFGLDVYDCVCVLNTPEQVAAFTKPRVSLGAEGSIAIGPVGAGASVDSAVSRTAQPMWSYMKSRGLWAGVQVDGTIIVSRGDANSVFYNERGITARKILCDDVAWPMGAKPLFEVLKALEGHSYDRTVVQAVGEVPTPGDTIISEKQERHRDQPEVPAETPGQQAPRDEPKVDKEELPGYKDDKTEEKDDDDYDIVDEKAKLAKSGY